MEAEQHHCSDVQLREKRCETDYGEVSELPGRDTEPGERGRDIDEPVMPPVDSVDESTSTGECMMGLICKNTVSSSGFFYVTIINLYMYLFLYTFSLCVKNTDHVIISIILSRLEQFDGDYRLCTFYVN